MASKNFILRVLCILCNLASCHSKISSRWDSLKEGNIRCKMLYPDRFDNDIYKREPNTGFVRPFTRWMRKANCTAVASVYNQIGTPDKNGTYDGWIGSIQRNEFDIAIGNIRPDSMPLEPVKFSPPLFPSDATIISRRTSRPSTEKHQITSFLKLDICVYTYVLCSCFFIVPIMYTFLQLHRKARLKASTFLTKYFANCYKVLGLLLDQENFNPSTGSARCILIMALSIFALVAVFGILLNTVGADLIVLKEPPTIDSLDDLLDDPMHRSVKPIVSRSLHEYHFVKDSLPGSQLHRLWQRMSEDLNTTTMEFVEGGDASVYTPVSNKILNGEAVFVTTHKFALYVPVITCFARDFPSLNEVGESIYIAKKLFASGTLNAFYSHQTHPYVEKIFTYVVRTYLEIGLLDGYFQIYMPKVPDASPDKTIKFDTGFLICMDNFSTKMKSAQTFRPFTTDDLESVIEFWAFLSSGSSTVLILEVIFGRYGHKFRLSRRNIWRVAPAKSA